MFLLAFPAVLSAQPSGRFTPCAPAEKFIEIKVTAKTIPATPTAPERSVWLVLSDDFPMTDQVQVGTDAVFKNKILEVLRSIRESTTEIGVGKGGNPEPGDPQQLELLLAIELEDFRPGLVVKLPAGLDSAPQAFDAGRTYSARLCLEYPAAGGPPRKVEIAISTLLGASLSQTSSFTLADAAQRFRARPEGAIPVRLTYGSQDLDDARKDPTVMTEADARRSIEEELFQVAATSFDKAVANGLLGAEGQPLVDQNSGQVAASNTEKEIEAVYDLNGLSPLMRWGDVTSRAKVSGTTPESSPGSATWVISVSGLQLAQNIEIEVLKSPIESEFDGSVTEKKFFEKRQKVSDRLRASHLSSFAAKAGHIITAQDIDADQALLRSDSKVVKSIGEITSGPQPADGVSPKQNLIYTVSRYLKAEKILNLRIGGGYSPEESVTGGISLEEVNQLGFSETATLDYSGGPQVQKIQFKFERPFENRGTAGWYVKTLGINVQYFGDKDKRFANLTANEIEARETGSEARLAFGYDSFSVLDHAATDCLADAKRKRMRLSLLVTPVLGYRDVNIKDDSLLLTISRIDRALLPRARSQTTTVSLDTNLGFSHDFRQAERAGLGMFNVYLTTRLQRGVRFFGADHRYNKASVSLTGEVFFGFISSKDFFLRYHRVMNTGTRGTPIFELFRLGGAQTVRGIEEGEFIGRKLSAGQVEFGIHSLLLWQLVTRKPVAAKLRKDSCPGGSDGTQSKLPFDITKVYLEFFYDRGRINDRDSFTLPGGFNRVAQGYGIGFELRELGGKNINLSIGYARSPESRLHKSGTIYTGVSYAF